MLGLWASLLACGLLDQLDFRPVPLPCDRGAWYPDPDGDGLGDPTRVYIGCEQPEGWVDTPEDTDDTDPFDSDG